MKFRFEPLGSKFLAAGLRLEGSKAVSVAREVPRDRGRRLGAGRVRRDALLTSDRLLSNSFGREEKN
jgi:hypothetical protein